MLFKAVIFDLDGTLLDTLEDLADSANQILAAHDMPIHDVAAYRYFVGEGLQVLLERIVPQGQGDARLLEQLATKFKEVYAKRWHKKTRMYDGIASMLSRLEKNGVLLTVLSNKPHEFTCLCVDKLLAGYHFAHVLGARPGIPKKPDPAGAFELAGLLNVEPEKILYLGDTATDMQTAVQGDMYPVGALWGFRTAEELSRNGAAALISKPEQLLDLF